MIQKLKNIAIAMNIPTGTSIVWHYCRVNSAVVFITIIPILICLKVQRTIMNDIAAITNAAIAIPLITEGSCPLITFMFIFPYELIIHTTPNATIVAKYSTITLTTRHPPQALMKNSSSRDRINAMNMVISDIGQVVFKSAIDSSKKLNPKSIVSAIRVLVG